MITIFNRKELLITNDIKRWVRARDILDKNNIEYIIRVRSEGHNWTSHFDLHIGINDDAYFEYKIYVNKKDYEQAAWLLEQLI